MGDVVLLTAAVVYDFGHNADIHNLLEGAETTWFHDESYDGTACKILDEDLMAKVYDIKI